MALTNLTLSRNLKVIPKYSTIFFMPQKIENFQLEKNNYSTPDEKIVKTQRQASLKSCYVYRMHFEMFPETLKKHVSKKEETLSMFP